MPSTVMLGSKAGAVAALRTMLRRGWDVKRIVLCSSFDYNWMSRPTLKEEAMSHGIPTVERQADLKVSDEADFIISYMYRYLVKAPTRALARRAAVNFHAAPLPEFGGWAFYNVAILENAAEYGCSCHYMDDGFDTGDLLRVRRFPINAADETAWSLERKAQAEMQRLFVEFCELVESGAPLPRQGQDASKMRYMRRYEFEALKEIPANSDPETIDRIARAFWYPPYPGAFMRVGDAKIEVYPGFDREYIAALLHANDLMELDQASGQSS